MRYLVGDGFGGKARPIFEFDSFVCLECGHVELYMDPGALDRFKERKEKAERTEKEIDRIENEIISCRVEMKMLERTASKEDKSVEERMAELEEQVRELKSVKASLLFDYDPIE